MLEVLTNEKDISAAQRLLRSALQQRLPLSGTYELGFPGGKFPNKVHHSPACAFWFSTFKSDEGDRWINLFGATATLRPAHSNSIICEINPPTAGINRRTAGVFLREPSSGTLFLGHRGRLAGGRPGIGKRAFRRWYAGNWQPFVDDMPGGEQLGEAVVLSNLDAPEDLVDRLDAFIAAAAEFKALAVSGNLGAAAIVDADAEDDAFKPEFGGRKVIPPHEGYIASCDHGPVVSALRDWAKARYANAIVTNRGTSDLVVNADKHRILFEVKTDGSTASVHTAVGQLMVYGLHVEPTARCMVLPAREIERWNTVLDALGIGLLGYEKTDKTFHIVGEL